MDQICLPVCESNEYKNVQMCRPDKMMRWFQISNMPLKKIQLEALIKTRAAKREFSIEFVSATVVIINKAFHFIFRRTNFFDICFF